MKRSDQTDALGALRGLAEGVLDESALERLRQSLGCPWYRVVAAAAAIVQARCVDSLRDQLRQAFDRFRRLPAKNDPGCVAKLALVDALDALKYPDETPFLGAIRVVQAEPVWGGTTDTAGPARGRRCCASHWLAQIRSRYDWPASAAF